VAYLTNALQVRTLVARHQSAARRPGLSSKYDVRERLPVGVADDEAGIVNLVERPRCGKRRGGET